MFSKTVIIGVLLGAISRTEAVSLQHRHHHHHHRHLVPMTVSLEAQRHHEYGVVPHLA